MKILVPLLLFLAATACSSKPKMTYCDLVSEEPEASASITTGKKRSTASEKASHSRR